MSIVDKDFKVKNGLQVAGTASFDSDVIIDTIRIGYDATNQRLKAYINNEWHMLALDSDIINYSEPFDGGSPESIITSIAIIDGGVV